MTFLKTSRFGRLVVRGSSRPIARLSSSLTHCRRQISPRAGISNHTQAARKFPQAVHTFRRQFRNSVGKSGISVGDSRLPQAVPAFRGYFGTFRRQLALSVGDFRLPRAFRKGRGSTIRYGRRYRRSCGQKHDSRWPSSDHDSGRFHRWIDLKFGTEVA